MAPAVRRDRRADRRHRDLGERLRRWRRRQHVVALLQAGEAYGTGWAQTYSAVTTDAASDDYRLARCIEGESLAQANGWGWQGGYIGKGHVDSNDFMAGCKNGIASVLGSTG